MPAQALGDRGTQKLAIWKGEYSEAHKDRFGMQFYPEDLLYALLHLVFEHNDVRCLGATAIHESQRVLAGDRDRTKRVAFVKSGVLNQPCRRDFYFAWSCGVRGDLFVHAPYDLVQRLVFTRCQDWVLEE